MASLQRICVFCGSRPGADRRYVQVAYNLGATLAEARLTLVYGGAQLGMMGALAQGALDAGGEVIGVMPRFLDSAERLHPGVRDMRMVNSMHERKALMVKLGHAFIALPGGFGTLDELFEIATWRFLQLHDKPVGLLNSFGYYDHILQFLRTALLQDFVTLRQSRLLQVADDGAALLEALASQAANSELIASRPTGIRMDGINPSAAP